MAFRIYEKYDEYDNLTEGVFYSPADKQVLTVNEYLSDDECDYEGGFRSFVIGTFDLRDHHGKRFNDANYTGYRTLGALMKDEFTVDCWVISRSPSEPATLSELCFELYSYEGIDLHKAVEMIDLESA